MEDLLLLVIAVEGGASKSSDTVVVHDTDPYARPVTSTSLTPSTNLTALDNLFIANEAALDSLNSLAGGSLTVEATAVTSAHLAGLMVDHLPSISHNITIAQFTPRLVGGLLVLFRRNLGGSMGNGHVSCSTAVTASVVPTSTVEAAEAVLALANPALANTVVAVTRHCNTSDMTTWCYGSATSQTVVSPEADQSRSMTMTSSYTATQLAVGYEDTRANGDNHGSVRTGSITPILSNNVPSMVPHIPNFATWPAVEDVLMMMMSDNSAVSVTSEAPMVGVYYGSS